MTRRLAFLRALLAIVLALAMPGALAKALPSLHGPAQYVEPLHAAIAAPERSGAPRGLAEGREDGPGDGLAVTRMAGCEPPADASARPVPREAVPHSCGLRTAQARAPPLPRA
jgi:hypothetical protein